MSMVVAQFKKRNMPTTVSGESITVCTTYSSFNKEDIDKLESLFQSGWQTWEWDDEMMKKVFEKFEEQGEII